MAVVMLTSVATYAQHAVGSVALKPMVGVTLANVTDLSADMKVGLVAGGELEYQMTDRFSLSGGLLYSMEGCKFDANYGSVANVKTKYNLEYLNVPILANFYVAPGFALKAGIQPGFKMNAKYKTDGNVAGFSGSTEGDIDGFNSVNFSIPVGLSYEFSDFVIDARYNWGISKIIDNTDCKSSVFQFTLGYKFDL